MSTRKSTRRIILTAGAAAVAIVASLLLMTALTLAQTAQGTESPHTLEKVTASSVDSLAATQSISVTFPPSDRPYAQEGMTVHPEPPIAGQPTELCAEVINHATPFA